MSGVQMNRRRFLGSVAAATLVLGFDPKTGTWVGEAHASNDGDVDWDQVPALDGVLFTDAPTREAGATDLGNIVHRVPSAVLRPGSIQDISEMVRFCRRHGIKVAARGQHHSTFGQGLTAGLIIEMSSLSEIHAIGPDSAEVDAGATWRQIVEAAFPHGLRPPGLTGYIGLSVGGTLSVGGCPLSNRNGGLVDFVQELTVVTGTGAIVECSERHNARLFEAVLGGLGQCGIIVRAKVDLVPALPMARTYLVRTADHGTMFQEMRKLVEQDEFNDVYNACVPPGSNTFLYEINATVFYDPANPPDDAHLMRDLSVPFESIEIVDRPYVDYATAVDLQIDFLRQNFHWDAFVKPWFDAWLPDDEVEQYTGEILSNLAPDDIGTFGFVLIFAQKRSKMRRPFYRVPSSGDWVWLFDVTTTSSAPGPDPAFADAKLARNREWMDRARARGGVLYPIGAVPYSRADWVQHYGLLRYLDLALRKLTFDPSRILTPGPGIF